MTGWLELSEELAHDPEELLVWSQRAVTFIATLPPKVKKASKKAAKSAPPKKAPARRAPKAKPSKARRKR
jgi:hypothetical protein